MVGPKDSNRSQLASQQKNDTDETKEIQNIQIFIAR